jgi:hypothetical protein
VSTAALIGNGLSIAFNENFRGDRLTDSMIAKFDASRGPVVRDAARGLAEILSPGGSGDGFEDLLGPLQAASSVIEALGKLATSLKDSMPSSADKVTGALELSQKFSDAFYRFGSTRILQLVEENSRAGDLPLVENFVEALYDSRKSGERLCVATLNYDALLLRALLALVDARGERGIFADLANGRPESVREHQITPSRRIEGHPIREFASDFPSRPVSLLSLHGSLTWLRDPHNTVWKFKLDELRGKPDVWDELMSSSDWKPAVVLTNQSGKSAEVLSDPFRLAYLIFRTHLEASSRWLIGGYGFGDDCVNRLLTEASASGSVSRCLVVTRHGSPNLDLVNQILPTLGAGLSIYDEGFDGLLTSTEWHDWSA